MKEKVKAAPKELARRGLEDGTARLRGQFRDTAQRGQTDEYGGDRIEDMAWGGIRRTERGMEKLIKGKRQKQGRNHATEDGQFHTQEVPTDKESLFTVRNGRVRIKAREAIKADVPMDGEMADVPSYGRRGQTDSPCPAVKTKEAYTRHQTPVTSNSPPRVLAQDDSKPIRGQSQTDIVDIPFGDQKTQISSAHPPVKIKDAYIQQQPSVSSDSPSHAFAQGRQKFVQERAASTAVKRRENSLSSSVAPTEAKSELLSGGHTANRSQPVQSKTSAQGQFLAPARDPGTDIPQAIPTDKADGKPVGKAVQSGIRTTGRAVPEKIKTAEQAAQKGTKTTKKAARNGIKTAELTAKQAVKTTDWAITAPKQATATIKAPQWTAQATGAAPRAAVTSAKAAARAVTAALKRTVAAAQGLITALTAGGGVVAAVVLVLCLVGLLVASPFGILFADPGNAPGAVSPSQAVGKINQELADYLEALRTDEYDTVEVIGQPPDWAEVLAVFAVRVAGGNGADASDVAVLDADRVAKLSETFWVMTKITTEVQEVEHPAVGGTPAWKEKILTITITPRTSDDMRVFYSFSAEQNAQLDELLENRELLTQLAGNLTISGTDAQALLASLPADLSPERRAVIEKALSLVGKVNYFWGGKSLVIGWDSHWGSIRQVTAEGNSTSGTYRPYGLDCSGFIDWVFYNASGGSYIMGHGGGAHAQHTYCTAISWNDAIPGDLVFYPDDSHVGIVGGRDENGDLIIIHCAFSANNVVITGKSGFISIGRPVWFVE